MAKEVAFGPDHLKAHHLPPEGTFSLASKVHQRKQSQDHVKERKKEGKEKTKRERAIWFASPFIIIHLS